MFASPRITCRPTVLQHSAGNSGSVKNAHAIYPYIACHVLNCFESWKRALSRGPVRLHVYNLYSNKEQEEVFQSVWKGLVPI